MKIIDAKLQVVEVPLPHPFPSTWNPGNPETKLFVTIAEIITDDGIHGYGAPATPPSCWRVSGTPTSARWSSARRSRR